MIFKKYTLLDIQLKRICKLSSKHLLLPSFCDYNLIFSDGSLNNSRKVNLNIGFIRNNVYGEFLANLNWFHPLHIKYWSQKTLSCGLLWFSCSCFVDFRKRLWSKIGANVIFTKNTYWCKSVSKLLMVFPSADWLHRWHIYSWGDSLTRCMFFIIRFYHFIIFHHFFSLFIPRLSL